VEQAAVQRQLADHQHPIEVGHDLTGGEQDAQGDRQAVSRSLLADIGRGSLTVIQPSGNFAPELQMAACTRSRDSCTAVSGKPTIISPGTPCPTSTPTKTPSSPTIAQRRTRASTTPSTRLLQTTHSPAGQPDCRGRRANQQCSASSGERSRSMPPAVIRSSVSWMAAASDSA